MPSADDSPESRADEDAGDLKQSGQNVGHYLVLEYRYGFQAIFLVAGN